VKVYLGAGKNDVAHTKSVVAKGGAGALFVRER